MRFLVRRSVAKSIDNIEFRDSEAVADSITIGRDANQTIPLRGTGIAPCQARINKLGNGKLQIRNVADNEIRVNGEIAKTAIINIDDEIQIGQHKITLIKPPQGFDVALWLQVGASSKETYQAGYPFTTSLENAGWSKRRFSWLLFGFVLLIGLIIPVSGLFKSELRPILRGSDWLPSDLIWLSGPMDNVHKNEEISKDCNVCHVVPFQMVRNGACADCHQSISHHIEPGKPYSEELGNRRCATCHKEHNEPSTLVRSDQAFCVDCHEDITQIAEDSKLANVSDFLYDHPDFNPTLLVPEQIDNSMLWKTKRLSKQAGLTREQSNLKFPHKLHLDDAGIEAPSGKRVLHCSDCHSPESTGVAMRPVTMENHCSECHTLLFDDNAPDQTVPHGSPQQVMLILEGYYARVAIKGRSQLAENQSAQRRARRPGRAEDLSDPRDAIVWAQFEASKTANILFEKSVCFTCHEITKQRDLDNPMQDIEKYDWKVLPVRLNQNWMPQAYFSHKSHQTQPCVDCHKAEDSEESGDVLMPVKKDCLECHGSGREADSLKIESSCGMCHRFHIPGNMPIFKDQAEEGQQTVSETIID